jgi:hypothetical protein
MLYNIFNYSLILMGKQVKRCRKSCRQKQALKSVARLKELDIGTVITYHGGVCTERTKERLTEIADGLRDAGSWSDWISYGYNPIVTGDEEKPINV